jgi:alpha/beta hydrolase fold
MSRIKMSEEINHNRRRFCGTATMTIAAVQCGIFGSADAQSSKVNPADVPPIKPGTNTSFGPLKRIDAGVLNIGYAEAGPSGGPVVIILHGWPYDIHSYVDVAPLLASAGYRVIVPYLRGYGTTRFLSPPLPLKVMPMVRRIRNPVPMLRNSRANIRTRLSRAASGTICLKKLRRPLPRLSWKSTVIDRRQPAEGG